MFVTSNVWPVNTDITTASLSPGALPWSPTASREYVWTATLIANTLGPCGRSVADGKTVYLPKLLPVVTMSRLGTDKCTRTFLSTKALPSIMRMASATVASIALSTRFSTFDVINSERPLSLGPKVSTTEISLRSWSSTRTKRVIRAPRFSPTRRTNHSYLHRVSPSWNSGSYQTAPRPLIVCSRASVNAPMSSLGTLIPSVQLLRMSYPGDGSDGMGSMDSSFRASSPSLMDSYLSLPRPNSHVVVSYPVKATGKHQHLVCESHSYTLILVHVANGSTEAGSGPYLRRAGWRPASYVG